MWEAWGSPGRKGHNPWPLPRGKRGGSRVLSEFTEQGAGGWTRGGERRRGEESPARTDVGERSRAEPNTVGSVITDGGTHAAPVQPTGPERIRDEPIGTKPTREESIGPEPSRGEEPCEGRSARCPGTGDGPAAAPVPPRPLPPETGGGPAPSLFPPGCFPFSLPSSRGLSRGRATSLLVALSEPRDRPRCCMAGKKLIVVFGATGECSGRGPGCARRGGRGAEAPVMPERPGRRVRSAGRQRGSVLVAPSRGPSASRSPGPP